MKLWHDDIRKPPSDWVWARTNLEAVMHLVLHWEEITEISLDHDLGLDYIDPEVYEARPEELWVLAGDSKQGDGRELVKWMIAFGYVPPKVSIHSWNPQGAREMAEMFADAGHLAFLAPFNPQTSWS